MPQPCEKNRNGHLSDDVYFRPFHVRVS